MKKQKLDTRKANRAGFTLIEILLVVVIIGLLASVAAVNIPKQLEKGRLNKALADIHTIGTTLDLYNMDEGRYPASLDSLTSGDDPYLKGGMIPSDPWGGSYKYTYPSSRKGFKYALETTSPDGELVANYNIHKKKK